MDAVKQVWTRFQRTPIWQAWQRYSAANGSLLAGGIAYSAFFSIFPAVALAFTIFGLVLQNQPDVLQDIRDAINTQLPGFVQDANGENGIIPITAPTSTTLSITAAVGLAGLVWAGLGWLGALRTGIREIFGADDPGGNFVVVKVRQLLTLIVLGVGVLLAAGVNAVANAIATTVADWIGLGGQAWLVTGVGLIASVFANALLVTVILRILSGVDLPWSGVRNGAIFGGIGMTLIQTFATRLIASATSNPLLASVAVAVGLLVFMRFIAIVMLLSASWAANDIDEQTRPSAHVTEGEREKLTEGPMTREHAAAALRTAAGSGSREVPALASVLPQEQAARTALGLPSFDRRAADRVSLASGAVLGAGAVGALGMLGGLLRRLLGRRRSR